MFASSPAPIVDASKTATRATPRENLSRWCVHSLESAARATLDDGRLTEIPQSNIRGFRDVNDDKANDSDRGSDGPDPQEWYTGGASSGQAVIDPRERPEARLAAMFDGARAHGAGTNG